MPLLFSYGTLQQDDVQLSTFGRRLSGHPDALPGWQHSRLPILDPVVPARLGRTHHANVAFTGKDTHSVPGVAFELTDEELAKVDEYEAPFSYKRVSARLASGRQAWIYVGTR